MVAEKLQLSMEELSEGGSEIPIGEVSLKHEPEADKITNKMLHSARHLSMRFQPLQQNYFPVSIG
jgi:hypothetical protein